jgi:hypothetical protein
MNHSTPSFESEARCQRCSGSMADLLSFLDGELEAQAAANVEKRLEACSGCRDLLDAHRQLDNLLDDADHRLETSGQAARPDLAGRVRDVISHERRKRKLGVALGLAAAALFLILPTIVLWDRISQGPSPGGGPEVARRNPSSTEAAPSIDGVPTTIDGVPATTDGVPATTDSVPATTDSVPASGGRPPSEDALVTLDLDAVVSDLDILEVFSETGLEPTEELVGTLLGDADEDDFWDDVLLDLLLESEGEGESL